MDRSCRDFLSDESLSFTESTGEVFYLGDDIAVPWDEDSVLFSVGGEEGGVVEVRDADEHFYVFIDDLDLFDEKEIKDSIGYRGMSMGPLFGFRWNDQGTCRFHTGPSVGNSYFCDSQDRDVPPRLHFRRCLGSIFSGHLLAWWQHITRSGPERYQRRESLPRL